MATYPNGVYAPSAKASGNTIQASFFNDPEAEITAIEDGLKNGLQHGLTINTGGLTVSTGSVNIGGPSSLATLSVSGGSTLASLHVTSTSSFGSSVTVASLGVTGNAVIAGSLTVGGVAITGQPGVRVERDAQQVLTSADWTGINWTVHSYDASGLHSTTTNSSRVNLTSSGVWVFGGLVPLECAASTGIPLVRVLANDTTAVGGGGVFMSLPSTATLPVTFTGSHYATSTTDYLVCQVFRPTGFGSTLSSGISGLGRPHFWVQRVSG